MGKYKVPTEDMLALRAKGMNNAEIARALGINNSIVYRRIGKSGSEHNVDMPAKVDKTAKSTKPRTDVTPEKVLALREQGLTRAEIAKKLGVSEATIHRRSIGQPEGIKVKTTKIEEKPPEPVSNAQIDVKTAVTDPKNIPAIETDLYTFTYVPNITETFYKLSKQIIPESWKFIKPDYVIQGNPETPILENYVRETFKERAIEFNNCDTAERDKIILFRGNHCIFHTGLYTPNYSGMYAYFERNLNRHATKDWILKGFVNREASVLRRTHPLPEHRIPKLSTSTLFDPSKNLRINTDHILKNPKNVERLPEMVKNYWNGLLLLETAVELIKRESRINPSMIEASPRTGKMTFLLPLYITSPETPDLVALLEDEVDYYHLRTCLTPQMAYLYARVYGQPNAHWLRALVE